MKTVISDDNKRELLRTLNAAYVRWNVAEEYGLKTEAQYEIGVCNGRIAAMSQVGLEVLLTEAGWRYRDE